MNTIDEIAKAVFENAVQKGFHPAGQTVAQIIPLHSALMHSEVTELFEAWRTKKLFTPCDKAGKMAAAGLPILNCLEEELADLVIRPLDLGHLMGVNMTRVILIKHQFNLTRPHSHGGKLA